MPLLAPLVHDALAREELPGCVVAIGNREGVRLLRAFGQRALTPKREAMTTDTKFDVASVTKAVATTASLMRLVERGEIDLDAPVARYLPAFAAEGKDGVRVRHLLTHSSGLPRVNGLSAYDDGPDVALDRILASALVHPVGQVFNYSDLGFITLGALVEAVSKEPLESFAAREVFAPLGMTNTGFLPGEGERAAIAPTEIRDDQPIRGEVDDPRAYRLGGVAGNAGLFSDARDLSRFARTLLRGGELDGTRLWSSDTVARFTTPMPVGGVRRTLGWDALSGYAKGRGLGMGPRTFGHSGYTGVSLWIDPDHDLFVLLLSNRVHMERGGRIYPLASSIADLAIAALEREASAPAEAEGDDAVRVGIDMLEAQHFAALRGRKVVLLTNDAARDAHGRRTLDRFLEAPDVELVSVWSPEHGLTARREGHVAGGSTAGLAVHSLFGKQRDPSEAMLHGAEAIVVDLQDAGARFYTYAATLGRVLTFADAQGLPVWVLDRPNPLGGVDVRGPILEDAYTSFVNHHPLPIQHGLTLGELGRLLALETGLERTPRVMRMQGWDRSMRYADTGLAWHAPSPNLRTVQQVTLYPAVALVEGTNVSVGRGTTAPFEMVGAPFIDADALAAALNAEPLPGVHVRPAHFRPHSARHAGKVCHGVRLSLEGDPQTFDPVRTGLAIARALKAFKPDWDDSRLGKMVAHAETLDALDAGVPLDALMAAFEADEASFEIRRASALLYPERTPGTRFARAPQATERREAGL